MRVTLASFNVFNLVLPEHPYYGRERYSPEQYRKKLAWAANQLRTMDADLVGFQEVFHQQALEELLAEAGNYAGAQVFVAGETGDLPRCALVSRLPVRGIEVIEAFPEHARTDHEDGSPLPYQSFHRPVLKAHVLLPGGIETVVFVVHLKSKRPMVPDEAPRHDPWEETKGAARSLMLRACEAAALRRLILDEIQDTDTPVAVLGDLNDAARAVTSQIIAGRQPPRFFPPEVKRKLWDIVLYSCGDLQLRKSYKDVYYTHLHDSHYESLDHILVSQEFVNENPRHIANVEYMRLYNDHLLDPALTDQKPVNWTSDHGQVLVSLRMREGRERA